MFPSFFLSLYTFIHRGVDDSLTPDPVLKYVTYVLGIIYTTCFKAGHSN
jgi:hypothetical protein